MMRPPSTEATTARYSTGAKSNNVGIHSVGVRGTPLLSGKALLQKNFAHSEPRAPDLHENFGLAGAT